MIYFEDRSPNLNQSQLFLYRLYMLKCIVILFSEMNHGDICFIGYYSKAPRCGYVIDWYNASSWCRHGMVNKQCK